MENRMAYATMMAENELRNMLDYKPEGIYGLGIHGYVVKFKVENKQIFEEISGKWALTFVEPKRLREMTGIVPLKKGK